jgi:hypothetical protein
MTLPSCPGIRYWMSCRRYWAVRAAGSWCCGPGGARAAGPTGYTAPWELENKHVWMNPNSFRARPKSSWIRGRVWAGCLQGSRAQPPAPDFPLQPDMSCPERISSQVSEIKESYPAGYPWGYLHNLSAKRILKISLRISWNISVEDIFRLIHVIYQQDLSWSSG